MNTLRKSCSLFSAVAAWGDMYGTQPQQSLKQNNDGSIRNEKFASAISKCSSLLRKRMTEIGAPGMVVGVSVNGKTVWSQGFGYADVENDVECHPGTVMRVGGISKCFTSVAMAKLWEEGKLAVDKPIHDYLPDYPPMKYKGKEVTVTLRHLLSHVGGVRHYNKGEVEENSTKHFSSISESLNLFKHDELVNDPEDNVYFYSTHGFTLISAVLEQVSGESYVRLMKDMFDSLDMRQTQMETNDRIVYGRSGCYDRKNGKLYNSRNIDFSFRGAGAGFLSTVGDLIKFGNAMLYSYQASDTNLPRGFLKRDTVRTLWTNYCRPRRTDRSSEPRNYNCGMGWFVYTEKEDLGTCPKVNFSVGHFGFVYGASSIILLVPDPGTSQQKPCEVDEPVTNGFDTPEQSTVGPPSGLCVAIQANISEVNFGRLARDISREFLKCNSQQFKKKQINEVIGPCDWPGYLFACFFHLPCILMYDFYVKLLTAAFFVLYDSKQKIHMDFSGCLACIYTG